MLKDKYKVAVLGCGPAGLLAAHAVADAGLKPDILSMKMKSRTGGAMYLHHPIPDMTCPEPEAEVTYQMMGDAETYARKVYGSEEAVSLVSFHNWEDGRSLPAWDLVPVYDRLWERYEPLIRAVEVIPATLEALLKEYDLIVSTIPAKALCLNSSLHVFSEQSVWIAPEAVIPLRNNVVRYNGTPDGEWYRASHLFGREGTEWGATMRVKPPLPGVVKVTKAVGTTCDCWLGGKVVKVGRFGTWDKRVLSHHAFYDTSEFVHMLMKFGPREEVAGEVL